METKKRNIIVFMSGVDYDKKQKLIKQLKDKHPEYVYINPNVKVSYSDTLNGLLDEINTYNDKVIIINGSPFDDIVIDIISSTAGIHHYDPGPDIKTILDFLSKIGFDDQLIKSKIDIDGQLLDFKIGKLFCLSDVDISDSDRYTESAVLHKLINDNVISDTPSGFSPHLGVAKGLLLNYHVITQYKSFIANIENYVNEVKRINDITE